MSKQVEEMIEKLKADKSITNIEEHDRYATIEYSARQNVNHIFHSRVFPNDSVKQRLIGEGSAYDVTRFTYDTCIDTGRNQKIITYRASDIGTTNNVHRVECANETLGHPFKREVAYVMMPDGKDRLQTKIICKDKYHYDSSGNRVLPLDNIFVTRVFRLFLRFQGYTMNEIKHIINKQETINGFEVEEMLEYLYSAIKSYHPFFYKSNGLSKYNIDWLRHTKRIVSSKALLSHDYKLVRVSRGKQLDSRNISPDEYEQWLVDREKNLKVKGYRHLLVRSGISNHHRHQADIDYAQKQIERIQSIHNRD